MRIEILVGSENPVFYPINKPKMVIGSDLSCDIIVSGDEISRKHLVLINENENYFVIDQGSTNGSFLNEERLVPGRRVEFTSYFPVRLGTEVLISLVSDEDAEADPESIHIPFPGAESSGPKKNPLPQERTSDRTTVLSLKDLQSAKTEDLVKRRQDIKKRKYVGQDNDEKAAKGKKKPKKKKQSRIQGIHVVMALIMVPAIYFTYVGQEPEELPAQVVGNSTSTSTPGAPSRAGAVVNKVKSIPKPPGLFDILDLLEKSQTCTTEEEKILCAAVKGTKEPPWGVATHNNQLVVMIDGTPYYEAMKKLLPPPPLPQLEEEAPQLPPELQAINNQATEPASQEPPKNPAIDAQPPAPMENKAQLTPEQEKIYNEELWELAIGKFLIDGLNDDSYLKIKDRNLVFAFFLLQQGLPILKATIAITPESLMEARRLASSGRFNYVHTSRAKIMNFREAYYELTLL